MQYDLKLTPASARDAVPGMTLRDHEVAGLQLRCRPTRKTWHLYYRTRAGDERRPKLGEFPEMPLSRAREVAKDLKEQIARGDDPSANWQTARAAPTVSDLCDRYAADYLGRKSDGTFEPKRIEADTAREYWLLIEAQIRPGLGSQRVDEIELADVERFLDDVEARRYAPRSKRWATRKTAPGARNHVRATLSGMFRLAIAEYKMRDRALGNPVDGTHKAFIPKRTRKAEASELPKIVDAIKARLDTHPQHAAALIAILLTGARVGEIVDATVADWRDPVLVLPKHKTYKKTGGAKQIPLPAIVRDLLGMIETGNRRPGDRLFGDININWIWHEIRVAAGCPDLQLRDFRRTFASYALSSGASLDQIGDLFGHGSTQTTKGYSYLLGQTKEAIVERGAAALWDAASQKKA